MDSGRGAGQHSLERPGPLTDCMPAAINYLLPTKITAHNEICRGRFDGK
jgi:hypothetical protein